MKWISATPSLEHHPNQIAIRYLARRFNLEPVLILKLFHQGITTEEDIISFLYPSITHLHDPFLLPEMKKAVYRIIKAIQNKEKILIFGDYDVDGMTAAALLNEGLRFFGANVTTRLPLRSEGYGLSTTCIEKLPTDVSLIITVDNGSSAHPAMQAAKRCRIDVIVTDHHEVLGEHPTCHAFVNPKRKDNTYPYTDLCGAGVVFKVVQALHELAKLDWHKYMWDYIEFVTIATIADLMPLTGENRVITWLGLQKMNRSPHPVLQKLFSLLRLSKIDSTTIGFQIAPLFNACGRIEDPNLACELLKNKNASEAELRLLLEINQKRKQLTKELFSRIEKRMIDEQLHQKRVIVIQDDFHAGLIGILASRIAERFGKPAIVMTNNGVASARSVQGSSFSIIDIIEQCSHLLKKYGGHQAAAGFSMESCEGLFRQFDEAIQRASEHQSILIPQKKYLCSLPIHQFSSEWFWQLQAMEPFGYGNVRPLFYDRGRTFTKQNTFGKENQHLKLVVKESTAVAFNRGYLFPHLKTGIKSELLYSYNGAIKNNFFIEDISILST